MARPSEHLQARAFSGIHVISPRLLAMMSETGTFSIIDVYLRLAAQRQRVFGFSADKYYWRDLGKPEQVVAASEDLKKRVID